MTREEIFDLRTTLGMTQSQFAKLVGVSFATVNRWENGHVKPSPLAENVLLHIAASIPKEIDNANDETDLRSLQ